MDDSKLRLRRTQHNHTTAATTTTTTSAIACEEGMAGNGGCGGNPNTSSGSSNTTTSIHRTLSSDNLSIPMNGVPSSSRGHGHNPYGRMARDRYKRQRRRRRIVGRGCRLCLGGLAAAIVSATLSVTFLPFSWTQVDYHHQLQHEVQYVYQKLHDNRQNYHSVVDNYHPNGMSPMHNHHHHIEKKKKKENHHHHNNNNNNNDQFVSQGPVDNEHNSNENENIAPLLPAGPAVPPAGPADNRENLRRPNKPGEANEAPEPSRGYREKQPRETGSGSAGGNAGDRDGVVPAGADPPKPEIVTCTDGTVGFLNDDYCDCLGDGLDEPDTSACSNLLVQAKTFECGRRGRASGDGGGGGRDTSDNDNDKKEPPREWIYASRVNDGIIDCSDGSDEYGRVMEALVARAS
mmetsp:Transcript_22846/g.50740  ORF Transcript_22846/g.50740 Transcript_22846/m.50740 type:complete len:404 (+) Transcript_22846:121-1332(+)